MEIKERMNDFFTLTQALAYCKRKRHPIKKAGLYLAARKYGFIEGTIPPYLFNKARLDEWLEAATKKPPKGWERVSKIVDKLGVSRDNIYYWIRVERLQPKWLGIGEGVMYVKRKDVEALVAGGRGRRREKDNGGIGDEKQ